MSIKQNNYLLWVGKRPIKIHEALLWAKAEWSSLLNDPAPSYPITESDLKLEAMVLLGFVLHQDRVYLYTWPEKTLTSQELSLFKTYVARRKAGEPIAYILGQKEFWSLPLKVSEAVLIPRPDTEILVEALLKRLPKEDPNIHILELGTGSGAIALALAKECPFWHIWATDISASALQVAQHNAKTLAVNSVQWRQGDWYDALASMQTKFHAIVSNPPYIAEHDPHLYTDLRYEPKNALVSENMGYFALETIIKGSPHYLHSKAWIFLEHGKTQAPVVRTLLKKAKFSNIKTIKDLAGVNRVTLAQYKKT